MVYNTTKIGKFPFSHGRPHLKGMGMGSVLLRTGGGGAGSSYMDIDDYVATTGINPYTRVASASGSGMKGLGKLSEKLSKLSIEKPPMKKHKNITMSF